MEVNIETQKNISLGPLLERATVYSESQRRKLVSELETATNLKLFPRSLRGSEKSLVFLGRSKDTNYLGLLVDINGDVPDQIGNLNEADVNDRRWKIGLFPADATRAAWLRDALPFLRPRPLGLQKSVGLGDRLGLATPGHIHALRSFGSKDSDCPMQPIFAQQSMRENDRTGRSPQSVMDDALWGVFQEGWEQGYGADADHLKTREDIDLCVEADYTFYTIDPGEFVDNGASTASGTALEEKLLTLPWDVLESSPGGVVEQLASKPIDLAGQSKTLSRESVLRAAAKYGRAVAHTVELYRHLEKRASEKGLQFELEMSVDETDSVTTLAEHIYIAHELRRLGVKWVSLAPRYFGRFEKGVDFLQEPPLSFEETLEKFGETFALHVAVSRTYGPYKLSLHSGSDKFSVYPVAARLAGSLVHLKTAGTSYLEALHTLAQTDPDLFRDILNFARDRYPEDRATYHVSAQVGRIPENSRLSDQDLPGLFEHFDAREVLHVTFGSVLNHPDLRPRFFQSLNQHLDLYSEMLQKHFVRHLEPFSN